MLSRFSCLVSRRDLSFPASRVRQGGCLGLPVGPTRPNGCFLSIALALIALGPWLPTWLKEASAARTIVFRQAQHRRVATVSGVRSCASIGVWLLSSFEPHRRPAGWAEGHAAWGRQYNGLLPLLSATTVTWPSRDRHFHGAAFDTLNGMGALFVIFAAFPVWRRFGLPYAVFILINILPPLAAGGLPDRARFRCPSGLLWFASVVPPGTGQPDWLVYVCRRSTRRSFAPGTRCSKAQACGTAVYIMWP